MVKVNTPNDKKNRPAAESINIRRRPTKERLIRLNDLIPKQDVAGGRKLLFGVTDTTQTNK